MANDVDFNNYVTTYKRSSLDARRGGQVFLANNQAAIYLHVDVTIVYTSLGSAHSAESIMHLVADNKDAV